MWWKNKEQLDWSKAGTVMAGDTLPRMFWNAVGERGDRVIFRQKSYGLWQTLTWRQLAEIVRETGMGLIELGFEVDCDCSFAIALMSDTGPPP